MVLELLQKGIGSNRLCISTWKGKSYVIFSLRLVFDTYHQIRRVHPLPLKWCCQLWLSGAEVLSPDPMVQIVFPSSLDDLNTFCT